MLARIDMAARSVKVAIIRFTSRGRVPRFIDLIGDTAARRLRLGRSA
jgi:hypothetical protein